MIQSLDLLVVRNLATARVRTVLSVSIVVLGVAMIIVTGGFASTIRASFADSSQAQTMSATITSMIGVMLLAVNIVIMLAAGFLIFNAFLMSVTERQQQIGMLRSLGMTRGQIMRMILGEGLLIASIGVILGLIIGPLLARSLAALLSNLGNSALSITGTMTFSASTIIQAIVLGFTMTLLAVLIPGWNATKISPLSALRRQSAGLVENSPRHRAMIAIGISAILWLYLLIAPPGKWVNSPTDVQLTGLFILIWLGCLVSILPILIEMTGQFARNILSKRWQATGRLMADNLERERQRVTLTVITLAVGMMMIISMSGIMQFIFHTLLLDVLSARADRSTYIVVPFDMSAGISEFSNPDLDIPEDYITNVYSQLDGMANLLTVRVALVPEVTAALTSGSFSYVANPQELQGMGDLYFKFSKGDWDTAVPIMEAGCGLLVNPAVANKHQAGIGDIITVAGLDGNVDCTIAGIGTSIGWATIISDNTIGSIDVSPPFQIVVIPQIGVDSTGVEAILVTATASHPHVQVENIGNVVTTMTGIVDSTTASLNSMLVLAVLAAALGIINTTMINVNERRHELGLIRAVGATRSQLRAIVMGEAALMGLVGAIVGLLAGIGMTIIFVVTFGGNGVGLVDLPLWSSAISVIRPALLTGVIGMIVAPLISAISAWYPTREILRGTAINTLNRT